MIRRMFGAILKAGLAAFKGKEAAKAAPAPTEPVARAKRPPPPLFLPSRIAPIADKHVRTHDKRLARAAMKARRIRKAKAIRVKALQRSRGRAWA